MLAFGIVLLLRMSFRGTASTHAPHAVTNVGSNYGERGRRGLRAWNRHRNLGMNVHRTENGACPCPYAQGTNS